MRWTLPSLLALLVACDAQVSKHYGEADHVETCVTACQRAGSSMQRYVDMTGECVCAVASSTPATPPSADAGR